jgi:hypothetical protein
MWNPFASKTSTAGDRPKGIITPLQKRRYDIGAELKARAYLHDRSGFIISAVAGIAEAGDVTVLPHDCTDQALGEAIWAHLLQYEVKTPHIADRKAIDWAAFKASGERSVRKFQASCYLMRIETLNQAVLLNARPHESLKPTLSMAAMANHDRPAIGKAVRECFAGARVLRDQGVI